MARVNNYLLQAQAAKQRFLTYDQEKLIAKFGLQSDESFLYVDLLRRRYRLCRKSGDLQKCCDGIWTDGNSYEEVMTLLDLLCDSRDDRHLGGTLQNLQSFGLQFHTNLLEEGRDPFADRLDQEPQLLHRAARILGAQPLRGGDMGYSFDFFEDLKIGLLFWHGDEEFAPRVRYLMDENAKQYLRYETMWFAVTLLRRRIKESAQ